jgi:chloramphenicol-sensitive protein RarD
VNETPPKPPAIARTALLAALGAYGLWGMLPLVLQLFDGMSAWLLTAQRVLWTIPCALAIAWVAAGRFKALAVPRRALVPLLASALLIGANWVLYIWAIDNDRVIESSLGYFINPLINVALGVVLFSEKLTRLQMVAIGLAVAGVLNQTLLVGQFPYVALGLALSFAAYGYVRKVIPVAPATGLLWETMLLAPIAVVTLVLLARGGMDITGGSLTSQTLLALSGPVTAIPLILFAVAARGMPMSVLGLMQYLAPSLQFATGIFLGEAFTPAHGLTFALIWAGLGLYSWGTIKAARAGTGSSTQKEAPGL